MKKSSFYFAALLFTIIVATLIIQRSVRERIDVLFVNGVVYTLDKTNIVTSAIAVQGTKIIAVGETSDLFERFEPKEVVDLQGKTVLPGFIDSHCHFLSLGISMMTVDLIGASSEDDAASRITDRVNYTSGGRWIRGRGWDQNVWKNKNFPTTKTLDRIAPTVPVYLVRIDGHAAWVNSKVLQVAGITRTTPDPEGGKIIRDGKGNPTGVFIDEAMNLIIKFIPPMSQEEMESAARLANAACVAVGLTSIHDMGVNEQEVAMYAAMYTSGALDVRIYAALEGADSNAGNFMKRAPMIDYSSNHLTVRALKLYMDGALGSRGAAMFEPYSDDPTNRGLTMMTERQLVLRTEEALRKGFQVCVHAIGDRANHIVLNAYEEALKNVHAFDPRLRIEHAQILFPNDIPRFKQLGVLPCMQPTHCTSDMYWAEARVGSQRIRGGYAWRSLLNDGSIIPGGSDFPVEFPNPLLGIYAAVTRKDAKGLPRNAQDVAQAFQLSAKGIPDPSVFADGWYGSEKMSRLEALRGFTTWSAYAAFEENIKGSLERGKLADFVVLSDDIMTCPPEQILKTTVEATIIGGKLIYGGL